LLTGRSGEARTHLTRVVELDPKQPEGHYYLAQALADQGQVEPAVLSYATAMKLDPRVDVSPAVHHVLAKGYLQKRQFREAINHEERALALAQARGDAQLAATLQKFVDDYRQLAQAANR